MNEAMKQELTVTYEADGEKIKLTPSIVQQYIVGTESTITLPEFKFFASLCKARGLNPFLKEAYCVKYGNNPAQIIVGKDAILKRAIRNANFNGMESGVIVKNLESGKITERCGTFYDMETEKMVGGWARVFRKDWQHPIYSSVSVAEAAQRKRDGSLNQNWDTKAATMIEKVAKVRALRETFVDDLGGMYETEEMNHPTEQASGEQQMELEIIQQDEPDAQPINQNEAIAVSFREL